MPVNPEVLAAIAQPVDYSTVNLAVLAAYNLAGMGSAGGSVDDLTGATTGDDPRDLIQGEIIRGTPYTATDMAYFEYLGWGPQMSPYRWHGESNTFTFDVALVGRPNPGYAITQIPTLTPTLTGNTGPGPTTPLTSNPMPTASAPSVPAPRPEVPPASPIPSPTTNGTPQAPQIIATGGGNTGGHAVTQDAKGNMFTHFGHTVHEAITTALAWIEAEAKKL